MNDLSPRYKKIFSSLWTGETGKNLHRQKEAQIVVFYLLTGPQAVPSGIYRITPGTISDDTGLQRNEVEAGLRHACLAGFCSYDWETYHVFVHNMVRFQYQEPGHLSVAQTKGLVRSLLSTRHGFVSNFIEMYADIYGLHDFLPAAETLPRPIRDPLPTLSEGSPIPTGVQRSEIRDQRSEIIDQGSEITRAREVGLVEEAEREPKPSQQRYREAYEAGVAKGKGSPFAMPRGQDGDLHTALLAHARGGTTGKPLRGDVLLQWIGVYAEAFAQWLTTQDEKTLAFYSSYAPRGFLKWLNEQDRGARRKSA